jgi:WD40 repeat protein
MFALPLCPKNTQLAKTFGSYNSGQIRVVVGLKESWSPCVATLEGHRGSVGTLTCSPDGIYLASGSEDGTIRTWNLRTGAPAGMPKRISGGVTCMSYCKDGRRLTAGFRDCNIRVWDTQTWNQIVAPFPSFAMALSCRLPNQVIWLSRHITPNESHERAYCFNIQYAHCSLEQSQLVEDMEKHRHLQTYNMDPEQSVLSSSAVHLCKFYPVAAVSPVSDTCVITGDDFKLRFWDTQTGGQIGPVLAGHSGRILDVTFSHDGMRLVSASLDRTVRIWDTISGTTITTIEDFNQHVALSNNGNFVVCGRADGTVQVWNADSGETAGIPLTGHIADISSVAFSPEDRLVISGSSDGNVRVWDWKRTFESTTQQITPREASNIVYVDFSTNGRRALSVSRSLHICVWDTVTGATIGTPLSVNSEGKFHVIFAVTFSLDAKNIILAVDNEIQVWGVDVQRLVNATSLHGCGALASLALCPVRNTVATCREGDPHVYIQDWLSGSTSTIKIPVAKQGEPRGLSLAFTADGRLIVSSTANGVVEVLDLTQLTILGVEVTDPYNISPSDLSRMLASTGSGKFDCASPASTEDTFWAVPTRRITLDMQHELTYNLEMVDGWIRGPNQMDLFWLPVENRERDSMDANSIPYAVSVSGKQMLLGGQQLTLLDFSDAQGERSRPLFSFFNNVSVVGEINIY